MDLNKIFDGNIFIHIPKCAGMSIWNSFSPIRVFGDQHASATTYIENKGLDYFNDIEKHIKYMESIYPNYADKLFSFCKKKDKLKLKLLFYML